MQCYDRSRSFFFFFFELHGLKLCSRNNVISSAFFFFFGDGVCRADSKAVLPAEGSHGLQREEGKLLRLEEEPSEAVSSLKPTCYETAA